MTADFSSSQTPRHTPEQWPTWLSPSAFAGWWVAESELRTRCGDYPLAFPPTAVLNEVGLQYINPELDPDYMPPMLPDVHPGDESCTL